VSRIGIIAALPGELKALTRGWQRVRSEGRHVHVWRTEMAGNECVAGCAGMGAEAGTRAFAAIESLGKLDAVLSIGWAGALQETLRRGDLVVANVVVDARTGERFVLAERERPVVAVSSPVVAGVAEKRRLAATYNGTLVDMEGATVARLAAMRGIPACCIKVITDEVTAPLPEMAPYIDEHGQMRMAAFVAHVLVRPHHWPGLVRLGVASTKAAKKLDAAVDALLHAGTDWRELSRTGSLERNVA
jgi:adenosylhomocysteine nucleosidase